MNILMTNVLHFNRVTAAYINSAQNCFSNVMIYTFENQ